jgi:hypothetical protein
MLFIHLALPQKNACKITHSKAGANTKFHFYNKSDFMSANYAPTIDAHNFQTHIKCFLERRCQEWHTRRFHTGDAKEA